MGEPVPFDVIVARFAEQALGDDVPPMILIAALAGVSIDLAVQSMGEEETRRWLLSIIDRLYPLKHLHKSGLLPTVGASARYPALPAMARDATRPPLWRGPTRRHGQGIRRG